MSDQPSDLPVAPVDDSIFDQFLQAPEAVEKPLEGKVPTPESPAQLGDDSIFDPYIQPELKAAKYDNTADMAKAFAQGLGKGVAGPLSPLALKSAGADVERMREREEEHPVLTGAGELAGLVGTGAIGKGFGAALGAIGKLAEIGEGASTVAKIGSAAAKGALENVAFQSSDELSKLILNDPNQSIASATADIGAAGILGGAFGGALGGGSALWNVAKGSETAKILKTIADKAGGIEGDAFDNATLQTLDKSGMDLSPELKGALASDPTFNDIFNTLRQTDTTKAGRDVQKAYTKARQGAADSMVQALGRSPNEVANIGELSKYEAGKKIGNVLADSYEAQVKPIAARFDEFRNKFGKVELQPDIHMPTGEVVPGSMSKTVDKIAQLAIDEGWTTSPSSDIMREVNRVMKELPLQKNIKNLTNYVSEIRNNTWDVMNPSLRRAGSLMKSIVKDAEAEAMIGRIGKTEGVEALADFAKARQDYAIQSSLKDALNDRLHIRSANTSNFAKSLREMAKTDGEAIFNRLQGTGDANLLEFLSHNYPEVASTVKDVHVDQLLKKASDKATGGVSLSGERLAKELKSLSPELQRFIAPPEALSKINAIGDILTKFNARPYNFSNTARTMDKMLQYVPSTATGLIAALATGNPIVGALIGGLTRVLGKEVPDAIKLGLLKFLGSGKPISSQGFKAAVDLIHSVQKGEQILDKGAKSVFKVGTENVIHGWFPSASDRIKLDKVALNTQEDPEAIAKNGDGVGHYMPDHGTALASAGVRITSYLQSVRPGSEPKAPLDPKLPLSPAQKAEYDKVLDLALNPMMLLSKVKDGSINVNDVKAVKSMYPDLFNRMVTKLSTEMTDSVSKGKVIPYKTKIGLSLMMGQPLDSTMTPGAFLATQGGMPSEQPQMPQDQQSPKGKGVPSSPALQKLPGAYRTPSEARQVRGQREK